MTREDAWRLVCEYVASDSLRKHMLAVEAGMRHYARKSGADEAQWGLAGLLHDFDYERWPTPPQHSREGARILREMGVDDEVIAAVLSHTPWNQDEFPLDRPIRKTLYACDELCGFIVACALVRPTRLDGMSAGSVKKKLKTPSFAASVSRDDIQRGAELMGVPLDDHITECIAALQPAAAALGLAS